jgi:hypothetical protein
LECKFSEKITHFRFFFGSYFQLYITIFYAEHRHKRIFIAIWANGTRYVNGKLFHTKRVRAKNNLQKKQRFTVSRKIAELKGVSFEKDKKLNAFLSVFSVLSYIFENK